MKINACRAQLANIFFAILTGLFDVKIVRDGLLCSLCDKVALEKLLARLEELMPEAIKIGQLRQAGLSDAAIAEAIGIKRTTFISRLKKARKQLAAEFPDIFTH